MLKETLAGPEDQRGIGLMKALLLVDLTDIPVSGLDKCDVLAPLLCNNQYAIYTTCECVTGTQGWILPMKVCKTTQEHKEERTDVTPEIADVVFGDVFGDENGKGKSILAGWFIKYKKMYGDGIQDELLKLHAECLKVKNLLETAQDNIVGSCGGNQAFVCSHIFQSDDRASPSGKLPNPDMSELLIWIPKPGQVLQYVINEDSEQFKTENTLVHAPFRAIKAIFNWKEDETYSAAVCNFCEEIQTKHKALHIHQILSGMPGYSPGANLPGDHSLNEDVT